MLYGKKKKVELCIKTPAAPAFFMGPEEMDINGASAQNICVALLPGTGRAATPVWA